MIHKGVKYGATENVTVAEFGQGMIGMRYGIQPENGNAIVCLKQHDIAHKVGEFIQDHENDNTDKVKPDIVFEFSNTDSIDALIATLEDAKKHFIDVQSKEPV